MELLIWFNTLFIIAAVIVEIVVVVSGFRKISADQREIIALARESSQTLSRLGRISLATLERVAPSDQQS
jgi:hypothetical protein